MSQAHGSASWSKMPSAGGGPASARCAGDLVSVDDRPPENTAGAIDFESCALVPEKECKPISPRMLSHATFANACDFVATNQRLDSERRRIESLAQQLAVDAKLSILQLQSHSTHPSERPQR